jgi:Ca2+-binding RTX toxin-like protein
LPLPDVDDPRTAEHLARIRARAAEVGDLLNTPLDPNQPEPLRTGADELRGGEGDDILLGMADDDVIHGEAGNDFLAGGFGDDELHGGDGDDILFGGPGDDQFFPGSGNDIIIDEDGGQAATSDPPVDDAVAGDADGDGNVTVTDLVTLVQEMRLSGASALSGEGEREALDANRDGLFNLGDVLEIVRLLRQRLIG